MEYPVNVFATEHKLEKHCSNERLKLTDTWVYKRNWQI